jgi:hypothetical protein
MENPLRFSGKKDKQAQENSWDKTSIGIDRVKKTDFYEEKGIIRKEKIFKGRPIIGRDKKINGGVYLGAGSREAIVVDDQKDQALEKIYQELLRRRKNKLLEEKSFKDGLLTEIWQLVSQVMPYDSQRVNEITSRLTKPDSKIYLSAFLEGGVCRHQALLTGYLLEKLSTEGFLGGKVSIDRNFVKGKGGHAWVRYTNSKGNVFILDSAKQYIGRLDKISDEKKRWFYERPEDTNPKLKILLKVKKTLLGD